MITWCKTQSHADVHNLSFNSPFHFIMLCLCHREANPVYCYCNSISQYSNFFNKAWYSVKCYHAKDTFFSKERLQTNRMTVLELSGYHCFYAMASKWQAKCRNHKSDKVRNPRKLQRLSFQKLQEQKLTLTKHAFSKVGKYHWVLSRKFCPLSLGKRP